MESCQELMPDPLNLNAPGGVEGARDVRCGVAPLRLDFAVAVVEDRSANLPGAGRVANRIAHGIVAVLLARAPGVEHCREALYEKI